MSITNIPNQVELIVLKNKVNYDAFSNLVENNRLEPIQVSSVNNNNYKDYATPVKEILASSSLAYLLSPIRSRRLLMKILWIIFLIIFFITSIHYVILNIVYVRY